MKQDDIQYLVQSNDDLHTYTLSANLKLHNLNQYIHKKMYNDEELQDLMSKLHKAYTKMLQAQNVVSSIIRYNYE